MSATNSLPSALHALVLKGALYRRARTRIIAYLLLGLGIACALMMVAEAGLAGLLVGLLAASPGAILLALNGHDATRDKAIAVLETRRGDIVWVFADPNVNARAARVVIGFADRGSFILEAGAGQDTLNARSAQTALVNELARYVPEATVGFSLALRAQFGKDPASLRRSA